MKNDNRQKNNTSTYRGNVPRWNNLNWHVSVRFRAGVNRRSPSLDFSIECGVELSSSISTKLDEKKERKEERKRTVAFPTSESFGPSSSESA